MTVYDYPLSLTSVVYEKACFNACTINCLMPECSMHCFHFMTHYTPRFLQPSAPSIPPSSAPESIDHYKVSMSAFLFINGPLTVITSKDLFRHPSNMSSNSNENTDGKRFTQRELTFRNALHLRLLSHPFSYISMLVQAIIAALSVHSSMGGKMSFKLGKPRAVRKEPSL